MFLLLALACAGPTADDSTMTTPGDGLTWVEFDYDCETSQAGDFTYPAKLPIVFHNYAAMSYDDGATISTWEPMVQPHWRPGAAWDPANTGDTACGTIDKVIGGRIVLAYRADE